MSGNLVLYSLIFFAANGQLLLEEQKIDISRKSNAQRVMTVAKGFAGLSPGAAIVEISVNGAIPSGGFEFDMGAKIAGLIPIDVQVIGPGGKVMNGQAFVEEDTISHGVDSQATYDFRCVMPLSLFA